MAWVIGSWYRLCPWTPMSSCLIFFFFFTIFNLLVSWYLFRGGECKYILQKEVNKEIEKMEDLLDVFSNMWNQSTFMIFECRWFLTIFPWVYRTNRTSQLVGGFFFGSYTVLYVSSIVIPILLNLLPLKSCFSEFHFCRCMVLFQNLLRT